MTMFEKGFAAIERPFGRGRKVLNAGAHRRRINPLLWALGPLALTGYLVIGHPAIPILATPTPAPVQQVASASPGVGQLTPSSESAIISSSGVSKDEPTRSAMANVLDAALGTVLAAGWLIAGAWVGIHCARISVPLDEHDAPVTAYATRTAPVQLPSDR